MAFVNEKTSEKDKAFFDSFKFKHPLSSHLTARAPAFYCIDKENEYYLFCLGGQGHTLNPEYPPYYYRLIIEDTPIEIVARCDQTGDNEIGLEIRWFIKKITVPESLNAISKETLINIIKEALICDSKLLKDNVVILTYFRNICEPIYESRK